MASIGPPALGAKGCVERLRPTGETTHYILCVAPLLQNVFAVHRFAQGAADWRSGPRWSIISVLCTVHPFPLRGTSPQGETRDMREKTASHILQVPFRRFPPLVGGATTLPGGKHVTGFAGRLQLPYESSSFAIPTSRGHYKAPLCCELLMKGLLFRALFCPRLRGKSGEAGKGEASAASQSAELFFMPYDIESQSRNADFISIARRAIHPPRPEGPSPPERSDTQPAADRRPQPSARRAVNLSLHNPSAQPAAPAAPLFYKTCGEAATTILGLKGRQT